MRRIFIITGLLIATAGCTSVEPLRPDMEARPVPSRLDEIAFINGLRQAYLTESNSACYTGDNLKPFRPKFVQGYRETDADADQLKWQTCVRFKPGETTKNAAKAQANSIKDYLDNGFGLTDLYCSRFIMVATEERQTRKMQRNTVSAVDALVGIALNAASAGSDALTVVNGGFAAIDSTYKNIDDAFLISPDKDTLTHLVQSAQDTYRAQVAKTPPRSFAAARSKIERYASFCTYDGMTTLVNGSLQLASQSLKQESKPAQGESTGTKTKKTQPAEKKATPAMDALIPE
jgi:hypothetical protein